MGRVASFILISWVGWIFIMSIWKFINSLILHDVGKAMLPAAMMAMLITVVLMVLEESKKSNQ